jgi:membrane-associated progesterone receptor component
VKAVRDRYVARTAVVPEAPRRRARAEVRDYKRSELSQFDGVVDPFGPVLIGVEGKVFDVGQRGLGFYGPGASYHCFAGRDASIALAKVSTDDEDLVQDTETWKGPDLSGLSEDEREALDGWKEMFQKYDLVGDLVDG